MQTRLIFTVFYSVVSLKLGQGHQNLINSLNYPNDKYIKFCLNTLFGTRDRVQTRFFGQNLTFKVHFVNEVKVIKI